ncbi:MAG: hypothetical protein GX089_16710 [Fibrobacter sp.]|nr:hypothetical protein [Fibrobacter sp.]
MMSKLRRSLPLCPGPFEDSGLSRRNSQEQSSIQSVEILFPVRQLCYHRDWQNCCTDTVKTGADGTFLGRAIADW